MADPTVATEKGYKEPPGVKHKCYHYALTPGKAWLIDDKTRDHTLVEVDAKLCKQAKYEFNLRWIDGRTVAEFEVGEKLYAQPIKEDERPRKRTKERRGVGQPDDAPPVPAKRAEAAPKPEPSRSKRAAPEANSPKPKRASKKNPPDLL